MSISEVLAIASMSGFILLHTALFAYYTGKIIHQLSSLVERVGELEVYIRQGGFPHCKGHEQRLNSFEKKLEHLEFTIEKRLEHIEQRINEQH